MSLSVIKKFFAPDPLTEPAHSAYVALVTQARKPFFYEDCKVADTIDGRFDVIVLHLFIIATRLKTDSPEMLRAIWEVFFSDMDRSLREMGASDTGIGKRIKKMVQAFYGRIDSYDQTIGDDKAFTESLRRNLYREAEVSDDKIAALISYVNKNIESLKNQKIEHFQNGNLIFV